MSSDAKWVIGIAAIVMAIFGSTWMVSDVMIRLTAVLREDLRDLRETLERAACGEFAQASPGSRGGSEVSGAGPNRLRAEAAVAAPPALQDGGNAERKPPVSACSGR